jgi:hypothetical protein
MDPALVVAVPVPAVPVPVVPVPAVAVHVPVSAVPDPANEPPVVASSLGVNSSDFALLTGQVASLASLQTQLLARLGPGPGHVPAHPSPPQPVLSHPAPAPPSNFQGLHPDPASIAAAAIFAAASAEGAIVVEDGGPFTPAQYHQ